MRRLLGFLLGVVLGGGLSGVSMFFLFLEFAYDDASPKHRDAVLFGYTGYMAFIGAVVAGSLAASREAGWRLLLSLASGAITFVLMLCGLGMATGRETLLTLAFVIPALAPALLAGKFVHLSRVRSEARRADRAG